MTDSFTLKNDEGDPLGNVRCASRGNFVIYNISDVLRCLKIKPSYATHVRNKMKAGKYLFATWSDIRSYLRDMRNPTHEAIQFMEREDPRIAPVQLCVQFADNQLTRYIATVPDKEKIAILQNLDLFLTDRSLFRYRIGEKNWKAIRNMDLSCIMEFPATYAMEILRGAIEREMELEEKQKPAPQPFAVQVKDGKLCIQLEIAGVQVQK